MELVTSGLLTLSRFLSLPGCLCCRAVLAQVNQVQGGRISLLCVILVRPASLMQSYSLPCAAHRRSQRVNLKRSLACCLDLLGSIQITSAPLGVFTCPGCRAELTHCGCLQHTQPTQTLVSSRELTPERRWKLTRLLVTPPCPCVHR